MANFIQLKKSSIVKIGIKEYDGTDTGEYLEFDLEDIELPLKYQECEERHKKNAQALRMQIIALEKKEDKRGKKLLSANEEEKVKLLRDFYKKEIEALDLFIGKGGTEKLLNGRSPYYTMFDDISDMLEPVLPVLKDGFKSIESKIKDKYKNTVEESNVLK